jgi:hypothetical protein
MAGFTDAVTGHVAQTRQNIAEALAEPGVMDFTFNWFDREPKEMLGVDVMDEPFDRERGFGLCEGSRATMLVLKLERLSDLLCSVVSSFVGRELHEARANQRRRSKRGEEYARLVDTLSLPAETRNRIYGHDWVSHFYTDDEIEAFHSKWS